MTTRYFYNNVQVSEKVAKGLFERGAGLAGYEPHEVRDIWEQASEHQDHRDTLNHFGIELQITH